MKMKSVVFGLVGGLVLLAAPVARAEDPACGLQAIDRGIDDAIKEIKQSPAMGHAGGHYGKAIKDLMETKKQLRVGCADWDKAGKKANTCEKFAKPAMIEIANPACRIEAIEAALGGTVGAIEASPACGHAGGHYAKARKEIHATMNQLRVGCSDWVKGGMKQGK